MIDGAQARDLADIFCHHARRRVTARFQEVRHNDDAFHRGAAQRVLDGDHAWVETGILDPYPGRSGDLSVPDDEQTVAAAC